jgi:hypothetical protein
MRIAIASAIGQIPAYKTNETAAWFGWQIKWGLKLI